MTSENENYMKLAIEAARKGIRNGQTPFGSCIVKNGKVLSVSHNVVWETTDITAHAEVTAIRKACKVLNSIDLSDAVIYSTCEPCPMCFSAIHWARIKEIYFGADIQDALNAGFNELIISNKKLIILANVDTLIYPGLLKAECIALFNEWKEIVNKPY
jgi:tRNA(Arg) A34 adenosine deaminase TadA